MFKGFLEIFLKNILLHSVDTLHLPSLPGHAYVCMHVGEARVIANGVT